MDRKEVFVLLSRVSRISAWLLIPIVGLYIISGYSMVGKYPFNEIMKLDVANWLHLNMDIPLVILFVLHAGIECLLRVKKFLE